MNNFHLCKVFKYINWNEDVDDQPEPEHDKNQRKPNIQKMRKFKLCFIIIPFARSDFLIFLHVFVCAVCKWNILLPQPKKTHMPMLGYVFQRRHDESDCPERLCCDETPQRGVNDALVYTSSHMAWGSGRTIAVRRSYNITGMTHCMAPSCPYTFYLTDSSAGCPEQAPDGWQVSCARDIS